MKGEYFDKSFEKYYFFLNRPEVVSNNRMPRRTMSLSPGWRLGESFDGNPYPDIHGNRNDEVELFLEKYVLPLQDSSSEYDSGKSSRF